MRAPKLTNGGRVRVLVVDDSPIVREVIERNLSLDGEFETVGTAGDGITATQMVADLRPDLILMDLSMPRMAGVETIRWVMENCPTPVLVVTEHAGRESTLAAMSAGAVELMPKSAVGTPLLLRRAKAIARDAKKLPCSIPRPAPRARPEDWRPEIIAIGSSTGGPGALRQIISELPNNACPVVLVQHVDEFFADSFTHWLGQSTRRRVQQAGNGTLLERGLVAVAPPAMQLEISPDFRCLLHTPAQTAIHVPSVDVLFRSVAKAFGSRAAGVLLTGMGRDGATGMRTLFELGALTIAQDRESSVVYGMPRAAAELGVVEEILPIGAIARRTATLAAGTTETAQEMKKEMNMAQKILCVDDSEVVLEATRLALENHGFEVATLANPLLVASKLRQVKPDLVLIDVNMPAVNGDTIAEITKQHELTRNAPVVLYSDLPIEELRRRAEKCGAIASIRKTDDGDELARRIKAILKLPTAPK